ncbi:hypothetical protein F5X68DRAFT_242879 [Plectosphaerella plurivora]|uniref:G domain-containing protein n=1 Tax=Plectosphaerella plurivora TaxID=936078 RepID=A0A9P8V892_9PEZI|nr:hypothetical protein F5X68DRAFT_242879 [Plectosphaerella plurivora]
MDNMTSTLGEMPLDLRDTVPSLPSAQLQLPDGAYDITSEKPPVHVLSEAAASTALNFADDSMVKLRHFLRKARSLEKMPIVTRRLAVLGDSGQGKSSLMNSLLHIPDIAHTSDTGSASTSVVIEYHQKREGQTSPIEITVEYSTGTALEEIVTNLVWSCRLYWLQGAKEAGEAPDEESDLDDCQRESMEAEEALQTAFGHHEGFSIKFLRDLSPGAEDAINHQLIQWAHAIEWPTGGWTSTEKGSTVWHTSVNNVEECAEKTGAFMKDKLWPFTKVIKVYLSSPILETGLILADLPGLHDTNLARVKASKLYLLDCEQVLVVSKIGRVITDQSVKAYLNDEAARLKNLQDQNVPGIKELKLTVVCTASDDINEKAAIADFVGEGKKISPAHMNQLKAELNAAKGAGNSRLKKLAKHRLKYTLISARAEHVINAMKYRYEAELGVRLDVFCVGNKAYEKLCAAGDSDRVHATGIPALRQYCHTITADARLAEARYWIQTTVPSFYQSTAAWAHRMLSDVNLGEEMRELITGQLGQIRNKVPGQVAKHLRMGLEASWVEFMATWTANQDKWSQAAVIESKTWEEWHWVSYNAWCRRNGHYKTRARGHVNWNDLMTEKMQSDLSRPWKTVFGKIKEVHQELVETLVGQLGQFVEDTMANVPAAERLILIATVDNKILMWRHDMATELEKLIKHAQNIKAHTKNVDELAYVTLEMVPTYRRAFNDQGMGIGGRQRACIAEKMNSGTIFANMADLFLDDTATAIKESTDGVEFLAEEVMSRLVHEFDVVLTPKKPAPAVESLVIDLKKTLRELIDGLAGLEKF